MSKRFSGIFMPLMFDSGAKSEGGATESAELTAIKQIGEQVENFKKTLGEKADAEAFTKLESEIKRLSEGLETLSAKQISDSIDAINQANTKIWKQLADVQEELAGKKEQPNGGEKFEMFSRKAVQEFVKSTFNESGKKTNNEASIEIKAAETFGYPQFFQGSGATPADITPFTGRVVDPVLYTRKRKRNFILDNFDIQTIDVPTLVYLVKVEIGDQNPVAGSPGGADWIISGALKPQRSFRVTTGKAEAKKVAIYGNVEDELLKDVASLENWIRDDFMLEMNERINDGLLNNNPAINANAPLGLKTNAVQYVASPAFDNTIAAPNYIDGLIALIAFMRYKKEEADFIGVSSDVYYRIMSLKDSQDRYLNNNMIYVNNLGDLYISGVKIVEADEEDIPSTMVMAIGRDLGFKIKAYGNMAFERGLNADDFRRDKTSYRGYQRFLTYIAENRENSVVYDSWVNIFAAIGAPAAA